MILNREVNSKFQNDKMFREGTEDIVNELPKIMDAILTKDGIVPPEKQSFFREQ